jgi:DNA invertase Pin-like site-specific DNA recombinase
MPTNIGVYMRVSTDKQDLLMQVEAIDKWVTSLPKEQRPTTIRRFADEGFSGKNDDRPGFKSLLAAAAAGEIDTVVVYKIDRLSRSTNTAIRTILDLDALGVAFISTSQPVLNLGHGAPFRLTMMAAFAEIAQIERETIVSRIKDGLTAAKKKGVKLGRRRLSERRKERAKELLRLGFSHKAASHQAGIGLSTLHRVKKEEQWELDG